LDEVVDIEGGVFFHEVALNLFRWLQVGTSLVSVSDGTESQRE
jgi:hypothetical protein